MNYIMLQYYGTIKFLIYFYYLFNLFFMNCCLQCHIIKIIKVLKIINIYVYTLYMHIIMIFYNKDSKTNIYKFIFL